MKALYFLALMARTASSIFNPRRFAQGGISASVADESGVHLSTMSTTARLLSAPRIAPPAPVAAPKPVPKILDL